MKILTPIRTAILILLLFPLKLSAEEQADTVHTFRFVPGRDMFYIPYSGNEKELARLEAYVERYRQDILAGQIPLRVDGYSTAGESEADRLAMAKVRSNRVKSELIIRQELTEACFVTKNHSGSGDYVTSCDCGTEGRRTTGRAGKCRYTAVGGRAARNG